MEQYNATKNSGSHFKAKKYLIQSQANVVSAGRHVVIQSEADVISAENTKPGASAEKRDSIVIGYSLRQGKIFVMIGLSTL